MLNKLFLVETKRRILIRIVNGNASQWLNVTQISSDKMSLFPAQFGDALALGYGHKFKKFTSMGCNSQMTLTHALNCKKEG